MKSGIDITPDRYLRLFISQVVLISVYNVLLSVLTRQGAADFHVQGARVPHRSEDEALVDPGVVVRHQRVVLFRFHPLALSDHQRGGHQSEFSHIVRLLRAISAAFTIFGRAIDSLPGGTTSWPPKNRQVPFRVGRRRSISQAFGRLFVVFLSFVQLF